MKMNIENYLHRIDASLKKKEQKDIKMMYIMIFAGLVAFSYLLFWDSAEAGFDKITADVAAVESKIATDNYYLQLNPESKIAQLRSDIQKIEEQFGNMQNQNKYIKEQIETISSLIYDERAWGEYLHSISTNAKLYNINLVNLTNKYANNKNAFGHILDISIACDAKFSDTMKFINSLEQSELVVDIHTININAKNKLESNLHISVWGITY